MKAFFRRLTWGFLPEGLRRIVLIIFLVVGTIYINEEYPEIVKDYKVGNGEWHYKMVREIGYEDILLSITVTILLSLIISWIADVFKKKFPNVKMKTIWSRLTWGFLPSGWGRLLFVLMPLILLVIYRILDYIDYQDYLRRGGSSSFSKARPFDYNDIGECLLISLALSLIASWVADGFKKK